MEIVYSLAIGILTGAGVWLLLRPRTFQVLMGLTLLSYATNLFIFGMGRLGERRVPILDELPGPPDPAVYADPVPQALILTAIVISFSFFAFLLVLAWRAYDDLATDNTDEMRVAEPVNEPAPPLGY